MGQLSPDFLTVPANPIPRAEAAAQRQRLDALLRDSPACVASLSGPDHMVTVANQLFRKLFGNRLLAGLLLRDALPELREQAFFGLLDEVYRTGAICHSLEEIAYLDAVHPSPRGPVYFTFIAQAVRTAPLDPVSGLLLFAYNVSDHVNARARTVATSAATAQQLAVANAQLATTNEELHVTNAELDATIEQLSEANRQLARANTHLTAANTDIRSHVTELHLAQKALRALNRQLETRVGERTSQLQTALRESEQQRTAIATVFDQTPALICILRGPEHRYDYFNAAYQRLYPGRALQDSALAEALPEAEAQGFGALLDRVYQTGEPYHGQEMPLHDVGPHGPRERFFDFTYQAFRKNGAVVGVAVCAFDVTEQVRVREQVAVAIFRGPRYVIELANPAVCAIWGRTADQVLGKPLFEALPEAAGQGFEELLDGVLATGVPYVARELPSTLDRAGQRDTVYWNFVYQPLVDHEGRRTGITVVATDVSESVRARQLLEKLGRELALAYATLQVTHVDTELANAALSYSNTRLTRTNADLDSFVYAASHDLKLPVLNLAGLFEELQRGVTFTDPAEKQVLLPMIDSNLRQLTTTLDDLAALGQMQPATHAPPESLALEELVADVLQVLEPQVRAAQARVTVDFEAQPVVSYPRAPLRTIVLNLLSNALKYADPARPARVHVSLWLDAGQPVLWVQDNGLGFDAAALGPDPFQLFRRFHDHTEGTGVGLYLVNRLVQANGGRIEVESRVGEGATFRVYLGAAA
ncbi:PAS domain-containing sensor histidine kinase [Hymenobacter arizonensis]|uniref:histidine kinase n=1 Tax=Hymenobacter arizonensis TaxID=1227077 RepID=A0A1I5UGS8_HYMAR|nr:PAS domain-containing sensor histidine kinase [Hymenobacter arizonensis]SFP94399.1 PAS domain S-box-containing protein [Hymenobacter arizonensis]